VVPFEGRVLLMTGMGRGWYVRHALVLLTNCHRRENIRTGRDFNSRGVCSSCFLMSRSFGVTSPPSVLLDDELPLLLFSTPIPPFPSFDSLIGLCVPSCLLSNAKFLLLLQALHLPPQCTAVNNNNNPISTN